jgi:hypothetical protein
MRLSPKRETNNFGLSHTAIPYCIALEAIVLESGGINAPLADNIKILF